MKNKILTIFLLTLINIFSQTNIKVVTYNIMGLKPGTDPETRLFHIIQNLKVLNPDIIGIQEINEPLSGGIANNQAKIIADSLSQHFGITYNYFIAQTHLSWNNQYKEFIGIITKHPVEQQGSYQLIQGAFPRKVVWNYINTPLGKINFFNTHFDYQSSIVRLQQATQTVSYINQQENQYNSIATILTGDFNDTPGSDPINYILNSGFWDSYVKANPTIPGFTVPANAPTSKIDFIFYKNIGKLQIDSSYVIMNKPYFAGSFCSDHLGVITIFSLKPTDVEDGCIAPKKNKLFQNFPNPFNPSTSIKFSLNKATNVNIKVYDILGNLVNELVNEEKEAGSHIVYWNGKDKNGQIVTSGVYLYKLTADKFIETKKMNLMK